MTVARRLSAATMALVLALFPLAMERCRTACVTGVSLTQQATPPAHACHQAAAEETGGPRMDPMARACGHTDEARTHESASLAAGYTRLTVPTADVAPSPPHVCASAAASAIDGSSDRSGPPGLFLPLNAPLRL